MNTNFLFSVLKHKGFKQALAEIPNDRILGTYPNYLQESPSLPQAVYALQRGDPDRDMNEYSDIVLCRLWETLLVAPSQWHCNYIQECFAQEGIAEMMEADKNRCDDHSIMRRLYTLDTYENVESWQAFENSEQLTEACTNIVNEYLAKDLSEKALSSSSASDYALYIMRIFPTLYFSMLYLTKYGQQSALIQQIATKQQYPTMPTFNGYEIWLRRKALSICLKQHGLQFILDNETIEIDYIIYLMVKNKFNDLELQRIKNNIKRTDRGYFLSDADLILNDMKEILPNW